MEHLENGALLRKPPAELVAWVSRVTLAEISKYPTYELERIGWLHNPVVDILYSMTNAGVWISRTGAGGMVATRYEVDRYGVDLAIRAINQRPTINGTLSTSSTPTGLMVRKIAIIPFDLGAGGAEADVTLIPALAGYYGVGRLLYWQQSEGNAGLFTFEFHDETPTGLTPNFIYCKIAADNGYSPLTFGGGFSTDNTAGRAPVQPIILGVADEKALQVDITGTANATGVIVLEYWFET